MYLNNALIRFKNFEVDYTILKIEIFNLSNIFNFSNDKTQKFITIFESLVNLVLNLYNKLVFLIELKYLTYFNIIYSKVVYAYLYFDNLIKKTVLGKAFIYIK